MLENIAIPNVPTASIVCMMVSLAISVGVPIVLCIVVCRKTKARISSFFIGGYICFVCHDSGADFARHSV